MNKIKIGLLGLGTVGSGVLKILNENQNKIKNISGSELQIKKALVRNPAKHKEAANDVSLVTDFNEILNDPEIRIVIEVMGGIHPAKEYIMQLLKHKKNVVTANKDLMATYGMDLIKIAKQNQVFLRYEASVAGGIPILNILSQSFAGDEITEISGIVNGTTNYILTQMVNNHSSFKEALIQAKKLGFAEADPTNDVTGKDAAYKMIILTRFAFGTAVSLDDFKYQGIESINPFDVQQIEKMDYTLKLLGMSKKVNNHIFVEVAPSLIKNTEQMAHVNNELNAIDVKSMAIGESFYFGPGAGSLPTANSVVSDLIFEVKNIDNVTEFNPYYEKRQIAKLSEVSFSFYISLRINNRIDISQVAKEEKISFQKNYERVEGKQDFQVLITDQISCQQLYDFVNRLNDEKVDVQAVYKIWR